MKWQPIETAPKDRLILVWYDHESDPYQDPENPDQLTNYAVWTEIDDYMHGRGVAIAKWCPPTWEAEDEYGGGNPLPAGWFAAEKDDFERACNPTHWMPIPEPPEGATYFTGAVVNRRNRS